MSVTQSPFFGGQFAPLLPLCTWHNAAPIQSISRNSETLTLIHFWAYSSVDSRAQIPVLHDLRQRFAPYLSFISVFTFASKAESSAIDLPDLLSLFSIDWPVAEDDEMRIWRQFHVEGWPCLVLIAPNGRIIGKLTGNSHSDALERIVAQAIEFWKQQHPVHFSGDLTPKNTLNPHDIKPNDSLFFPTALLYDSLRQRLIIGDSGTQRLILASLDGAVQDVISLAHEGRLPQSTPSHVMLLRGIAGDHRGNLYCVDELSERLFRINPDSNHLDLIRLSDLYFSEGAMIRRLHRNRISSPAGLVALHDLLMLSLSGGHQIVFFNPDDLKINALIGTGSTPSLDGAISACRLNEPVSLVKTPEGVVFLERGSGFLRRVSINSSGRLFDAVTTIARMSQARHSQYVSGLTYSESTKRLYFCDSFHHQIVSYCEEENAMVVEMGTGLPGFRDGDFTDAQFRCPEALISLDRRLIVADTHNHALREIDLDRRRVRTLHLRF